MQFKLTELKDEHKILKQIAAIGCYLLPCSAWISVNVPQCLTGRLLQPGFGKISCCDQFLFGVGITM